MTAVMDRDGLRTFACRRCILTKIEGKKTMVERSIVVRSISQKSAVKVINDVVATAWKENGGSAS